MYEGLHSTFFAEQMSGGRREEVIERFSGLNKPVWGFGLYRIIALSRSAYIAGYNSEDEAGLKYFNR